MTNILTYNASSADNQQERVPKNIDNLKYYLAGFADGEGSFSVTICKSKYAKLRWKIDPLFQVYQHKDNSRILHVFKDVFECGYVSEKGGNPSCHVYCIDSIRDLLGKAIPYNYNVSDKTFTFSSKSNAVYILKVYLSNGQQMIQRIMAE